ncbi:Bug family tripartite tricarboxylate transporter substrate binding protein [Falsiroseomonas sp. HW251]|uniref:Bug family tripartite tricarboxylate transporter substrate binding protein n=1 Tax=Falsiroseomonas sp. HW251 TaxID=3390998 RepID=UPI003D311F02
MKRRSVLPSSAGRPLRELGSPDCRRAAFAASAGDAARRSVLAAGGAILAALTAPSVARAQSWSPDKPLRMIIPVTPGGTADTVARMVAEPMGRILGQTVVVENRPGANGQIAAVQVARAPAAEATMLYCPPPIQILNPLMIRNLQYDAQKDFAPLAALIRSPKLLVVRPDFPATDVAGLIAMAKARPGQVTYCSSGIGSSAHLAAALFAQMAGIELLHIPYRGTAPGVQDIIGGRVDFTLDTAASLIPLVRDNRLKALAVSTRDPAEIAPELPPIARTLPGYHEASFNYLVVTAGAPPPAIHAMNAAVNQALRMPSVRERLASLGSEALGGTPEELAAMVAEEIERWRGVITAQRITIE